MKRSKFIKTGLMGFVGVLITGKLISASKPDNQFRSVEYYDNGWHPIEFEQIKKGMYIRMFEPDGTPVTLFAISEDRKGYTSMALADASFNKEFNVWYVQLGIV